MYNYTILSKTIKDDLNFYCNSLINGLGVVNKKFVYNMINGIIKSNSCHLTKIGRCLHEDITLKKTEERLSRNLSKFSNLKRVSSNYNNYIKSLLNSTPIYFVDETDLAKPNVKSF